VLAALGLSACPIYGSIGYWAQVSAGATGEPSGSGSSTTSTTGTGGGGATSTSGTGGTGGATDECPPSALGTSAPIWSQGYGGPSGAAATSVAVDAAGDIVVVGSYQGAIDFGCGPLASSGGSELFVAKLSASGTCVWSEGFGGSMVLVTSVALDAAGDVFVTGSFEGVIDFGGDPLTSVGAGNVFVAKLYPNGGPAWSEGFGDGQSQGASIAVDSMGNVLVIGNFHGSIDFGGTTPGIDGGANDGFFVAKLDPTGAPTWSKSFPNVGAASIAVDASGNAIVSGEFTGSFDLGGCTLTSTAPNSGFVAKLDPSGGCTWNKVLGTALATGVAVDAGGNVVITGAFNGSVNLGGSTFTSTPGMANMFMAKLDYSSGAHMWSQGFPGGEADPQGVAVDSSGDLFVTGAFTGSVNLGGPVALTSAGGNDILLVSFDAGGNYRWAKQFGNAQDQDGTGVAVDPSCHVVIVGAFEGTVGFGGNPLMSAGNSGAFVAEFAR
jgi:hypothetical protein